MKRALPFFVLAGLLTLAASLAAPLGPRGTELEAGKYADSLFVALHYVGYLSDIDPRFADQAARLKRRLGSAPFVRVGFAASVPIEFTALDLNQTLTREQMAGTLHTIDQIIQRARNNQVSVHITLTSGFFHGTNDLRRAAIQQDVRNAQWFADGWIGDPESFSNTANSTEEVPPGAWITPSRYARPLRARMEEGVRIIGTRLAAIMADGTDTLITVSGDGEVELNFERNIAGGEHLVGNAPIYTDYSPFMVEEFRDWVVHRRYEGDRSPASDDNHDGHTFNQDFETSFATWKLRYFDSSDPIPLSTYLKLPSKLPAGGAYFIDNGFDAPRTPAPGNAFWELWLEFRQQAIADYVHDFASWLAIPPSRFYTHQIPADFLFGTSDSLRLKTSASPVRTAFAFPDASTGITVFNTFDGRRHKKTGVRDLYDRVSRASPDWGIFEYNPSVPVGAGGARGRKASTDVFYYLGELQTLNAFHPHVIVPFAWTDISEQRDLNIQGATFETALREFIRMVGSTPWRPRPYSTK